MSGRPAVFLDKDGTVVVDVPYNVEPGPTRLTPRAIEALRLLAGAGYLLVIVSNQSGVARGYFDEAALAGVEAHLRALLIEGGVALDGFRCCPHHPEGSVPTFAVHCGCRKPAPGLLLDAARDLGIDPARSWMIGDKHDDVEAGHRAGCRSLLIAEVPDSDADGALEPDRVPDAVFDDLLDAARHILAADSGRGSDLRHAIC